MSAHIIGRPDDDLLHILLGHGADPEQAFIRSSGQGPEKDVGVDDRLLGEEPPCRSSSAGDPQPPPAG